MPVSEEDIAALEAEVAALLGILEMLSEAGSDGSSVEALEAAIYCYADQVEQIGAAVGNAGFLGLRDVCLLFREHLIHPDFNAQGLSDDARQLLEEWPILVMGYFADPTDAQMGEPLLEHLCSPVWKIPVSAEDAGFLREMLTCGALEPDADDEADREEPAVIAKKTDDSTLEIIEAAELEAADLEVTKTSEAAFEFPVITDPAEALSAQIDTETVADTQSLFLPVLIKVAISSNAIEPSVIADETLTASAETNVDDLQEEAVVIDINNPESAEEECAVVEAVEAAEADEADEANEADEEEPAGSSGDTRQELLDIICAEIVQIAEAADEILAVASAADSAPADRAEVLSGYAEHLERLGDASGSIGLVGLQQVCAVLQNNLTELAVQDHPLTTDQRDAVQTWPDLALNYLQALNDHSACAALANYLRDDRWPQPLMTTDVEPLIDLLATAKLVTEDPDVESRPRQATTQDVSLDLPADVNAELLDGLLQELPHQAAEFSASIQRLAAGGGGLKDVDVARRIAHTLKGAGNTVGVRGIATLTHQMEDILQALAQHEALPNRALAETLLNAADCLESMSESLLGMSAPPSQAQAVLQEVLDWANRIDRYGIPADNDAPLPSPVAAQPTPVASVEAEAEADSAAPAVGSTTAPEATLRVPAHLVDELLRLVGESIILTGQVQEQVRKTVAHTRSVMGQNRLFLQLTNELEQLVDIRNVSSPLSRSIQRGDFDPLELEQYNELNTVTHRLVEAVTDTRELDRAIADNLSTLDSLLVDQSRLHRESQEAVLRTRMVPIQTIVPRLQRSVRQTCRLVDKEAELTVRGADTPVDSNVLNDMVDPLMHILRNAVDHGIESPAERQRLGKPPVGHIELRVLREGNAIVIRCQDDGAGLNLDIIRQTALERGLISADQILEDEALIRLILLPGFSTRGTATQTSGRGIGMDMVYSRLLDMKGSLHIQSKPGAGCLMEMRLPVTLIATHALLVRLQGRLYALSDRGIEQILYPGAGTIQRLGKITTYQVGEAIYELSSLETLLNLPTDQRSQHRAEPPALLVREETGAIRAVLTQEVVDSRDLVVKPLGRYVPKINGVVGATILGDGSVAPVLDLPELLRTPVLLQAASAAQSTSPTASAPRRQTALAVDDSLSARRSLAQFAQDAGLEVRTARDGLEAVEIINRKRPDIVLADLEMPRMNGLELAAHLRANQATKDLPVIMITSRSTDKHRLEAERAGVNVYVTKPFVEDELLGHIKKLLRPS
jgi:chemotaxis protein histidine kinase CheA